MKKNKKINEPAVKKIQLGALIETVKAELLDYQEKHEEESALFELMEVELEASVGTTIDANGKVNVFALEFGTKAAQANTHKVRLKLTMGKGKVGDKIRYYLYAPPTALPFPPEGNV